MDCNQALISLCCTKKKASAMGFAWRNYKGPPLDFTKGDAETGYTPVEELLTIRRAAEEMEKLVPGATSDQ